LVGALEPVVAPADFDVRLRARIARERETHQQPFIFVSYEHARDRVGGGVGAGCRNYLCL